MKTIISTNKRKQRINKREYLTLFDLWRNMNSG